jgi:hypothetical protein
MCSSMDRHRLQPPLHLLLLQRRSPLRPCPPPTVCLQLRRQGRSRGSLEAPPCVRLWSITVRPWSAAPPPPSLTPTTPPIPLADRPRSRRCPYHLTAPSVRNCPSTSFYHQGWSLPQPQQPPPLTQHCYHRSPPSLGNTVLRCPSLCRRPPAGPARQGHQDLSIIRHGQTRCRWA